MNRIRFRLLPIVFCCLALFQAANAQFPVKLPGVGPKPTPSPKAPADPASRPNRPGPENAVTTDSTSDYPKKPVADSNPVFLRTTLDIRPDTIDTYWKMGANKYDHTSWVAQVRFKVFYKGTERLRYRAEYFLPNGQSWYSEALEPTMSNQSEQTVEIASSRAGNRHDNVSTDATGLFGVKITDKDGQTAFEGKFRVNRFKPDALPKIPKWKNVWAYYVDQDWNLPIGYVWLDFSRDKGSPLTAVNFWLKGEYQLSQLEARLFLNGQQIATTDDMGEVSGKQRRFPNRNDDKSVSQWEEYQAVWYKFRAFHNRKESGLQYPQARFMKDMPGDYTVKVFYQGAQIRELAFRVGGDGNLVDNGIAAAGKLGEPKIVVPVKVTGSEKWNPAAWKTDAFYGNPLSGFSIP